MLLLGTDSRRSGSWSGLFGLVRLGRLQRCVAACGVHVLFFDLVSWGVRGGAANATPVTTRYAHSRSCALTRPILSTTLPNHATRRCVGASHPALKFEIWLLL